jgi:hypothetical protein
MWQERLKFFFVAMEDVFKIYYSVNLFIKQKEPCPIWKFFYCMFYLINKFLIKEMTKVSAGSLSMIELRLYIF